MTVISSDKNADDLTLTVVAEFSATPEQVWELWEDPRKLERWWGPPGWPASFTRHEFEPGGQSRYFMSGPGDQRGYGWWRIDALDQPHWIDFANGLAGDDGEPMPGIEPMAARVTFEPTGSVTRMTVHTRFTDTAQMEKMLGMGMREGMTMAMGQIDALLAPPAR